MTIGVSLHLVILSMKAKQPSRHLRIGAEVQVRVTGQEIARDESVRSGRIDEVRADLEGLNREAALAQGRHQGEGDRGLAHTAVSTGDHQAVVLPCEKWTLGADHNG